MQITNSFSLNVKDYCEYCPDFSPCAETLDITTIADLPNRKAIHVIGCIEAERCEKIRERMKAEMEAQREKAEKVQCNVRGCENERSENGTDSDNGQSDSGETCLSDVRQEENQSGVSKGGKGRWKDRLRDLFLRTN